MTFFNLLRSSFAICIILGFYSFNANATESSLQTSELINFTLPKNVVRIQSENVVGTGIFLSPFRVLTAAHVMLNDRSESMPLSEFPKNENLKIISPDGKIINLSSDDYRVLLDPEISLDHDHVTQTVTPYYNDITIVEIVNPELRYFLPHSDFFQFETKPLKKGDLLFSVGQNFNIIQSRVLEIMDDKIYATRENEDRVNFGDSGGPVFTYDPLTQLASLMAIHHAFVHDVRMPFRNNQVIHQIVAPEILESFMDPSSEEWRMVKAHRLQELVKSLYHSQISILQKDYASEENRSKKIEVAAIRLRTLLLWAITKEEAEQIVLSLANSKPNFMEIKNLNLVHEKLTQEVNLLLKNSNQLQPGLCFGLLGSK